MGGTFLLLLVLTFVPLASAQKATTVFGETVKGVVVTANEATREITLAYPDKDTTQTFVGVLESGYKQKLKDGTFRELAISEFKPGLRLRVFFKQKTEMVSGQKVKVAIINRIDFLGRDEYTNTAGNPGSAAIFSGDARRVCKASDRRPAEGLSLHPTATN
jgi:hypothetical protein